MNHEVISISEICKPSHDRHSVDHKVLVKRLLIVELDFSWLLLAYRTVRHTNPLRP